MKWKNLHLIFSLAATSQHPRRKNGFSTGESSSSSSLSPYRHLPNHHHHHHLPPVQVNHPHPHHHHHRHLHAAFHFQGLWVAFSTCLHSCLRRNITKGETGHANVNHYHNTILSLFTMTNVFAIRKATKAFFRVLCSSSS